MFYDTFVFLCKQKGLSPSRAAIEANISKSLVTKWKTNGTDVPSPDVIKKLSVFFQVSPDYLLGYDLQSQIDTKMHQIDELKKEIRSACAERKEELQSNLFVLEESLEDLLFAQNCSNLEKENKKNSPSEENLTEGERDLLTLFRQIPEDQQPVVLAMIRAALSNGK